MSLHEHLHVGADRNSGMVEVCVSGYLTGLSSAATPIDVDLADAIDAVSDSAATALGAFGLVYVYTDSDADFVARCNGISGSLLRFLVYGNTETTASYSVIARGPLA